MTGQENQPLYPLPPRTAVVLIVAFLILGAVVLGLLGSLVWSEAALRPPVRGIVGRILCGVLAVMMTAVAAKNFFLDAPRSRLPRWKRGSAVLSLAAAVYLFVFAFKGG